MNLICREMTNYYPVNSCKYIKLMDLTRLLISWIKGHLIDQHPEYDVFAEHVRCDIMHQVLNPCFISQCRGNRPVLPPAMAEQIWKHRHQRVTLNPWCHPKTRCAAIPDLDLRCRCEQGSVNVVDRQLRTAPWLVWSLPSGPFHWPHNQRICSALPNRSKNTSFFFHTTFRM
jgi:hypothetical protein